MGKVIILGTAAFIPAETADNTHLAIQAGKHTILVDTASNPFLSLNKAGIDPNDITELVLTHFHPDHISGLPLLIMGMWFLGRKAGLEVYGLGYTLERAQKMLELFNISQWKDCFPIHYHVFSGEVPGSLIDDEDIHLMGAEVRHLIPTMGIRAEFPAVGKTLAYSCDTEPCQAVELLAKDADFLLHESAGDSRGHSSPAQAGATAARAKVKRLFLIHYPADGNEEKFILEAKAAFGGDVFAARDQTEIPID